MSDSLSRREWLAAMSAAGTGALVTPGLASPPPPPPTPPPVPAAEPILPLTSTTEVFVPPRGRGFMKFSFDFPEPSVAFDGYRFGFLVFTRENAYALDASRMSAERTDAGLTIDCTGFVWAGGQQSTAGHLTARIRKQGSFIEWDVTASMDQPIKTVTAVIRGAPRGRISTGGQPFDPRDDEILYGYPFSGGDLHGSNPARGMSTPFVAVQGGEQDYFFASSLDDRIRTKRFFFQPGEQGYRLELVHEAEGWLSQKMLRVPAWRIGRTTTLDEAVRTHYAHVERAYRIQPVETRPDLPGWARETSLVLSLQGMHYTGYIFNDYARMLETLRWVSTKIPAERVLVFLASWDGRYYWDYPVYKPNDRMGGEAGFRRLIDEGKRLGFRMMPMFGANSANRNQPAYAGVADGATHLIDGDRFDLNWVDWDNDRHQEGWLSYMNLGVLSWRRWLTGRIDEIITKYGVDAYFLDIAGGWLNNPRGDMHEGMREMVLELRRKHPQVMVCGEMLYDGLLEFIPFYQVYSAPAAKYARFFSHLSHPAPGRGSSGVHEAGFGRFDPQTLALVPGTIPTITVVDDTFRQQRAVMEGIIERAKVG